MQDLEQESFNEASASASASADAAKPAAADAAATAAAVAQQQPAADASAAAAPKTVWRAATDPNSGKQYFFNTVTNETAWELPVVRVLCFVLCCTIASRRRVARIARGQDMTCFAAFLKSTA